MKSRLPLRSWRRNRHLTTGSVFSLELLCSARGESATHFCILAAATLNMSMSGPSHNSQGRHQLHYLDYMRVRPLLPGPHEYIYIYIYIHVYTYRKEHDMLPGCYSQGRHA